MKIKRTGLQLILAIVLTCCLLFSVSACGKDPAENPSTLPSATITAPTETAQPTEEPTTIPTQPTEEPTTIPTQPTEEPTDPSSEPTISDPFAGISFTNKSVTYDGTAQSVELAGLPESATVSYEGNEQILPGTYEVKAIVIIGDQKKEYTAQLRIRKARVTIKADDKVKDIYDLNPDLTYTVTGLAAGDAWEADGEINPALFTGNIEFETECEHYSPVGVYDVKIGGVSSDIYEVRFQKGNLTVKTYTTDLVKGGFQLNNEYDTVYNGEVVNWMGVNYWGMFHSAWDHKTGTVNEDGLQKVYRGLETLASYNVKAIRFFPMIYYAKMQESWFTNRQEFIYTWHRIINKAASLNIGLVPSVCFNTEILRNGLKETYGDDWLNHEVDFGELAKAIAEGKSNPSLDILWDYTDTFVSEFVEHPAIMIWEWANEYNLIVDVSDNKTFTTANAQVLREAWAERVYNLDPYHRLIGSGDSVLRNVQYSLWKKGVMGEQDTLEQHEEVLAYLNGGKFSTISAHDYFATTYGRIYEVIPSGKPQLLDKFLNDREAYDAIVAQYPADTAEEWQTAPYFGTTTLKQLFEMQIAEAKALKKGMYVGESSFSSSDNRTWTMEEMEMFLSAYAVAMRESGMPLALFWNYDHSADKIEGQVNDRGTGVEFSWNERWEKGQRYLEMIKRFNGKTEE